MSTQKTITPKTNVFRFTLSLLTYFICFVTTSFGQSTIFQKFVPSKESAIEKQRVLKADHFNVKINDIYGKIDQNNLKLNIPFSKTSKVLNLKRVNIFAPNARVLTENGEAYKLAGQYSIFHGYVEGKEDQSLASVLLYKDQVKVMINDDDGDYEIHQLDKGHYTGYYSHDQKEINEFECGTSELLNEEPSLRERTSSRTNNDGCVDIYFEIDFSAFQKNDCNSCTAAEKIESVTTWVVTLFNQVALQYARVQIPLRISDLKMYTTTDPYSIHPAPSSNTLYAFRDSMRNQGFNGRLAHLLVGRGIGGGIAYLGSLCSSFTNVAVSGNLAPGVEPYPNYSWNVMVVAHEIGHNFGSRHTHDCVWNGNNTAIDGCYAPGGSCDRPPKPTAAVGGTIMSYCHLNVGTKLVNGFGPQPGALIFDRYNNAACSTSDDCSDVPPTNDICHSATPLIPQKYCNVAEFTTVNGFASSYSSDTTCASMPDQIDVWFSTIVPSDGNLKIETKQISGGLTDLEVEIFTGDCFGLLHLDCDKNSGDANHASISISDSTLAMDTIFIRVTNEANPSETGSFGICITNDSLSCLEDFDPLVEFYNRHNALGWTNASGWSDGAIGSDCNICNWHGVTCDKNGKVISLKLPSNNLDSTLDLTLDSLQFLHTLDLSNNLISDTLPYDFDELSKLQKLDLSSNQLTGILPNNWSQFRDLKILNISYNNLSDNLPTTLPYYFSAMDTFDVSNNNFSGCIPYAYFNLCEKNLNLSNNPGLIESGDTEAFCLDRTGTDSDQDGHCFNYTDCNDNNSNTYDDAPEICDNEDNDCDNDIDEGLPTLNTFMALEGSWNDSLNWSLGYPGMTCHDIEFGLSGTPQIIEIPMNEYVEAKSITIPAGDTLLLDKYSGLGVLGVAKIINNGHMEINGNIYTSNQLGFDGDGLVNNGSIKLDTFGSIYISEVHQTSILNYGSINGLGSIGMGSYSEPAGQYGLLNYGTFINAGNISIGGNYLNDFFKLMPGSTMRLEALTMYKN